VHVLWGGDVGGIERLVHDLVIEQSRLGSRASVAFGRAEGFFADRIRELGVEVIDLGLRSGYELRPGKVGAGAALLAASEVVHAHGFNPPLGRMMSRAGKPIVFTEHGQFGLGRRLGFSGLLKRQMQRAFLTDRVSGIAANSRWTADLVARTYGIERSHVSVVHNGIRLQEQPPPAERDGGGDELVVVFVGRLKAFKRVDRIIRAIARMQRRDEVRVLIAGRGPLEEELRALARKVGVESHVEFLGWKPDIVPVLRRADVVVLPSEGEPFGLAMLEGCAQGLLPIAFRDGGGALECISPDGRVVQDEDDLARTLDELNGSDFLSEEARSARASWARREFPISKTVQAYSELYRTALERTPDSS
jgi:1,4-alpha-glucan branching enzyme